MKCSIPGRRRASGIIIAIITVALLIASNSKTSMGLVVLAPLLAGMTLLIRRKTGLSPAIILLSIPVGWWVFSTVTGFTVYRLSNILYGDPTFTGRSIIWDFVRSRDRPSAAVRMGLPILLAGGAGRAQHRQRARLGEGHAERP